MSYDLVTFNECRKLILRSFNEILYNCDDYYVKYSLFQFSLLGENFFRKYFQCNSTSVWGRVAYLTAIVLNVGNRY